MSVRTLKRDSATYNELCADNCESFVVTEPGVYRVGDTLHIREYCEAWKAYGRDMYRRIVSTQAVPGGVYLDVVPQFGGVTAPRLSTVAV